MKRIRLAVIGFGGLGRQCAEDILASDDLELAGIVRRPESLGAPLPPELRKAAVAAHVSELKDVAAALVCVPATQSLGVTLGLLQGGIPIVECACYSGEAFRQRQAEIHRAALRHRLPVIVGAGWDPGALSLFRCLLALLVPHGNTEIVRHPGTSLHHTLAAANVKGVKEALASELRTAEGGLQRYVYVELKAGADAAEVERAIRSDPLFLDEETQVFTVDSVAALESEGRGIVMERRAAAGSTGRFLVEARFDREEAAARMMLAGARALPGCKPGAYSLFDLPPAALWGELRGKTERDWL
jgi:diaminopimelate dehydrogenase